MSTDMIRWGIIGVGDVCEVKSGPAFQKAVNSQLVAVMRRDGDKAADFAKRHGVPKWYDNIDQLLQDDEINAVYVASPPRYHCEHALAVLAAGRHLYLEKPMAMSVDECEQIIAAEQKSDARMVVAHYRRALPAFIKMKELLDSGDIGTPRVAEVKVFQSPGNSIIATTENNWRWNPEISGGGLFHDVAPHMLDLMLYYFGRPRSISGVSLRQNTELSADDLVQGSVVFENNVLFTSCWSFSVAESAAMDKITITGDKGQISCNFFGDRVVLTTSKGTREFEFINPENIQLSMIEKAIDYFLDKGPCPCTSMDGLKTIEIIQQITGVEH